MSHLVFTSLVRGLMLLTLGAAALGALAQPTFQRVYGRQQQTHLNQALVASDGDYVLAGITYRPGRPHSDLWVMKTDPAGEPIWQKSFDTPGPEHVFDLIETRDGNYTLLLSTQHPQTQRTQALVMQIDRYGQTMWARRFGGEKPGGDQLRALVQAADGGFALAGFTGSRGKGQQDIWLLRLDAVGQQVWERTYGTRQSEMAHALIQTRNGGFVLGGSMQSQTSNGRDFCLLRTDRHGRGLWRKVVPHSGSQAIEQLVEMPQGGYLAAGWGRAEPSGSVDGKLWRFSASGAVTWGRDYGGQGADAFYDLVATERGYTVLGRSASFDQTPDLWLMHCDWKGNRRWEEHTQGDQHDWAHSLALTQDGGYLIGGATRSFTQQPTTNGLLIKTNARGRFGPAASGNTMDNQLIAKPEGPASAQDDNWYKPNLYVLSIGVSDYAHEPINLTFAHTDAQAVAQRFGQLRGSLFREVHQRTLTNETATLANIKQGIAWLESEATQLDMILVFISAHGALDHKGNLYLLPHDVRSDQLFATGLDIRALTQGMNGVPCKKLILLDACHSGQSGHDLLAQASAKAANVNDAVEDFLNKEPGLTVMTSSSGNEFSYENPRWQHGAFTKALLEGLDGNADYNSDRVINLLELNLYVTQRVKDLTAGRQHPYTPINLFGDIPLFVIE